MKKYIQKNKVGDVYRTHYKNADSIYYTVQQADDIIKEYLKNEPLVIGKKRAAYYNCPCSFDIETSSFSDKGQLRSCMYIWQVCLNGACIIGRTWDEFVELCYKLHDILGLSVRRILILYVHNLAFECQFIRKLFEWERVFATDERKPLQMLSNIGIEFRCSYRLSGYGLAKTCEQLLKYPVSKMVGDLDYDLVRHSMTQLSDKEIGYCLHDVIGVCSYILEEMERNENNITHIPMTATGYARNLCREYCFGKGNKRKEDAYKKFIQDEMTLTPSEYMLLKEAYQGGFTHSNIEHVGLLQENVTSYDFTSSYPACLVAFHYPMGKGTVRKAKDADEFEKLMSKYCCVFRIKFFNLEQQKDAPDSIISESKCRNLKYSDRFPEKTAVNNGRIVHAAELETTITNVDYEVYKSFYLWDAMKWNGIMTYKKGYLPSGFIEAIAYLYRAKTELKGVKGREEEYQHAKALLNAIYGMCCTAVVKDETILDEDWTSYVKKQKESGRSYEEIRKEMAEEQVKKYNTNCNRFLHYSWGVFCTAYARRNLLLSMKNITSRDHNYSDTDSLKIFNEEQHVEFIEKYNEWITKRIEKACEFHGMPKDTFRPKTIKGKEKPLGVWDREETYDFFKTLGAKRYMTLCGDVFSITVAGVNKKTAIPYLLDKNGINYKKDDKTGEFHITEGLDRIEKVFSDFADELVIPAEFSGKLTCSYIDFETSGTVEDYRGTKFEYHELSSCHLGKSEYCMSVEKEFSDLWELYR